MGKCRNVNAEPCPTWASAEKVCMAFAQLGQGPKIYAGHLPNLGKRRKFMQGICPTWARAKKFCMTFAQLGQKPKKSAGHLLGLGQAPKSSAKHWLSPQKALKKVAELLILLQKWRSVFTKLFFEAEKASRTCTDKIYTFIQITRKTS